MTQTAIDILSREPVIVHVDHSLVEAGKRMKEADVGALRVVDGDELVGVITDRDLIARAMARGVDLPAALVSEVMNRHIVFCREHTSVSEAALLMAREWLASARRRRLWRASATGENISPPPHSGKFPNPHPVQGLPRTRT